MAAFTVPGFRAKTFSFKFLMWSLVMIAFQMGVYVSLLDRTVGTLPFVRRAFTGSADISLETRAVVLKSAFNSVRAEKPEYYYDLATYWMHHLQNLDIEAREITDDELAKGLGKSANLLVLPWAVCMSDEQRQAVADFASAGNGVIATGPVGVRGSDCSWFGWDFFHHMTGMEEVDSFTPQGDTFAAFRGGQFFSAGMPVGFTMDIPRQEFAIGESEDADAYWSDARFKPLRGDTPGEATLALHRTLDAGRVVWLGFNERLAGRITSGYGFMDHYSRSAIRWAARHPVAVAATWPKGYLAAAVVAAESGDDAASATGAAALLKEESIPGAIFVRTGAGQVPVNVVNGLRQAAEVGLAGAASDDAITSRNVLAQAQALKEGRDLLGGAEFVSGFKPPMDYWSIDTLAALRSNGFRYVVDRGGNFRAVPEVIEFAALSFFGRKAEVIKVPAAWADDAEVIADYEGPSPWEEDLADGFLTDFQRNLHLGGAYTLNFSATLLGKPENLHILRRAIREMKQEPVWFASYATLCDWWSRRQKVQVVTKWVTKGRVRVAVVNKGREAMENFSVLLHLPYAPKKIRLISEQLERNLPASTLLEDTEVVRLDFRPIKKGSSQVFLVGMDET